MYERKGKAGEKDSVFLRDVCTQTPVHMVPLLPILYTPNSISQENIMGFSADEGSRPTPSFLLKRRLN